MDKQYRIGGIDRGQLPISGSVKRWQILTSGLGDDAELVIGHHLEQRLSQYTQALDLFRRSTAILGLVILPQGVDSLLNQRLAGLNHSNEGALVHYPDPTSFTAILASRRIRDRDTTNFEPVFARIFFCTYFEKPNKNSKFNIG